MNITHPFTAATVSLICTLLWGETFAADIAALRDEAFAYERAMGVKQDYGRAYRLYCQAARLGDRESSYNLGFMYFNGRGIPRHLGLAMGWFSLAAKKGDVYAKRMLRRYAEVAVLDDPNCPDATFVTPKSLVAMDVGKRAIVKLVNDISPQHSVDANLVLAVIDAESGFNSSALSPKNAQGLMQLIPATAERFGVRNVWDPKDNITGGVMYLSWLLRHFKGNVEHAVAAYNAGEKNVEAYEGIPPFDETKAYVRRIMGHYKKTTHPIPPVPSTKIKAPQTTQTSLSTASGKARKQAS